MERNKLEAAQPLNGNLGQPPPFTFRDPVTGKQRAIREMTDEELARHSGLAAQELAQANNSLNAIIQSAIQLNAFVSLLNYELHRRRLGLVLPPGV